MSFFSRLFGGAQSPQLPPTFLYTHGSFKVADIMSISGMGTLLVGTITEGGIAVGFGIQKEREFMKIHSIERFKRRIDFAVAGEDVGVLVGASFFSQVKKGDVLEFSKIV